MITLQLKPTTISSLGGAGLLRYHNNDHIDAIVSYYPELKTLTDNFYRVNKYKDPKNQRIFMDNLAKILNVQKMEDWYQITRDDVLANGGSLILEEHGRSFTKSRSY